MLEKLKYIFDELCKSNMSILNFDNKVFISQVAEYMFKRAVLKEEALTPDDFEPLKYLIMICNITYNRTDSDILPVEDGVYDCLNEAYKSIFPNFQVGSCVIQFKSQAEKKMMREGREIIKPFDFIPIEKKDDIRKGFEQELLSFNKNRYTFKELLENPIGVQHDINISKRTHNTEHNHPDLVGTLDKVKFVLDKDAIDKDVYYEDNVKILERDFFVKHINMGIIRPDEEIELVLELKYDGISVEADCTDIVLSARTRGDTGAGLASDITPMLYGYQFTRNDALKDRIVGVKFEAIMSKTNLEKFNRDRGYNYANCRTAIIGLFGASDANLYRDYITLIPLAVDRANVPEISNRKEEIELLNKLYRTKGEPLRHVYIKGTYDVCLYLIKKFVEEAKYARNYLDFMFDGVVVSYTDENIRTKLGRENFINKYSMAVKFDPLAKLTTFLGYTFEIGQSGNVCPMIYYAPVEFFGTIHTKSSGASLARFNELSLKIGDIIEVVYTNDVMPRVNKFDCEQNRQNQNRIEPFIQVCPECGSPIVISESGKSAICPNVNCQARRIARMSNMLQKIGIKGFAESTISQIGVYSFAELMKLEEDDIQILGPTNAHNFIMAIKSLHNTPQDDYKIIGALGFTNMGTQKWKLVFDTIRLNDLYTTLISNSENKINQLVDIISNIRGLGKAASDTIINEFKYFKDDFNYIIHNMKINNSSDSVSCSGKHIRFTGCRDRQLEEYLRSIGHDADSNAGVTKQTDILIIPMDGFTSTKTSKVSSECMVVPLADFKENLDKYLM